jgi:hypothetical protein
MENVKIFWNMLKYMVYITQKKFQRKGHKYLRIAFDSVPAAYRLVATSSLYFRFANIATYSIYCSFVLVVTYRIHCFLYLVPHIL